MKRFLLTAGDGYYPQAGSDDWVDMFDTREEAERLIRIEQEHDYFSKGPRKGQIRETRQVYFVNDKRVDWYEIIDLENWSRRS